ncbi:MAG: FAD-dependent oxidoreductase [Deltaproteobacteria bacterium]|nr:FAD-dependent oxidoreductase [Deltaproteobacteria bacterium]
MSNQRDFHRLFSPIQIGSVKLKNRIIQAPMVTRLGAADGFVTAKEKRFYLRRAQGGIALATVGNCTIMPNVQPEDRHDAIWDDRFIPAWKDFVAAMHDYDMKVSLQLCHAGSQSHFHVTHTEAVAPSEMVSPVTGEKCRALTKGEIEEIVEHFAAAAARAKEAGADMVEIQGVQGFLVQNFMTPLFNKRTDEYGGSLEGRMKFPLEIVKRIKKRTGRAYPVVFRMVASDLVEGGITVEEAKRMAPMLVEAGADALHFTAGAGHHVRHLGMPPVDAGQGCIVDLVAQIKPFVDVPVIVVQRIITPRQAEEILEKGQADIIGLGRALVCDPDWAKKVVDGIPDEIRRCIGCCQGCYDEVRAGRSWTCLYNPEVGKEDEYEITKTESPKKVAVIGGGPAGLEAARVAALRGHDVALYEQTDRLGGQWILACVPPRKEEYLEVIRWYKNQIEKLGVKVLLSKKATAEDIAAAGSDVAIVATGVTPILLKIPGSEDLKVVTAHDVLAGNAGNVGNRVLVIGGGMVGIETAEFLSEQGKKVTVVEMLDEIASEIGIVRKPYMNQCLSDHGVEIFVSTKVERVSGDGVMVNGKECGKKNIGSFDSMVLAVGARPRDELARTLEGKVAQVHVVGDALKPANALAAIADAARIAREI